MKSDDDEDDDDDGDYPFLLRPTMVMMMTTMMMMTSDVGNESLVPGRGLGAAAGEHDRTQTLRRLSDSRAIHRGLLGWDGFQGFHHHHHHHQQHQYSLQRLCSGRWQGFERNPDSHSVEPGA